MPFGTIFLQNVFPAMQVLTSIQSRLLVSGDVVESTTMACQKLHPDPVKVT